MNEITTDPIVKDEQYEHLVKEIDATRGAFRDLEYINRINFYYNIGKTVLEYRDRREIKSMTRFVAELSKDTGIAERNYWWSKEMVEKYTPEEALKFKNWTELKLSLNPANEIVKHDLSRIAQNLIKKYGMEDAKEIAGLILAQ
jgi:hypothetical protein